MFNKGFFVMVIGAFIATVLGTYFSKKVLKIG